jgi:hypothetical protein
MNQSSAICSVVVLFLSGCGLEGASRSVGAAGASLSLGSALTLVVPAGAVDDGTQLTIREVPARHGEREFELGPVGLILKRPAQLSVEAESPMELVSVENEREHRVEVQHVEQHRVHAELHRLGVVLLRLQGGGGTASNCVDDDACGCGSECALGQCTAVVLCTSNLQCGAGVSCRQAQKHGQGCGVQSCHP